jgi:hypothetical protein
MSDVSYPGNSNKKKDEVEQKNVKPEKLEKSISGKIIERKKPLGKRIAETFTGDDSHTVGNYVLFEVALPAFKQLLADAGREAIERLLFGDSGRSSRSSSRPGYSSRTNYASMSTSARREEPRTMSQKSRATHDFSEIVLETRGEAEKVRDDLIACVEQYDVATVSDLYDLVGITGSFADDKWGWYDLRDARIRRIREGYLLDLPKTQPIE